MKTGKLKEVSVLRYARKGYMCKSCENSKSTSSYAVGIMALWKAYQTWRSKWIFTSKGRG